MDIYQMEQHIKSLEGQIASLNMRLARAILDSDAKQRATIRDLKARLKVARKTAGFFAGDCPALDLKNKNWRTPKGTKR